MLYPAELRARPFASRLYRLKRRQQPKLRSCMNREQRPEKSRGFCQNSERHPAQAWLSVHRQEELFHPAHAARKLRMGPFVYAEVAGFGCFRERKTLPESERNAFACNCVDRAGSVTDQRRADVRYIAQNA